jgi:addiction module HigA family antidote
MSRSKKIPPLHPGEVLYEDFIVPTAISIHRLAMDLRVPANRIAEIVKGERAITADTALRLSRYLGTSAEFWLALQSDYDLEKAKDELKAKIDREVRPRKRAASSGSRRSSSSVVLSHKRAKERIA